jgi:hypothetical protein
MKNPEATEIPIIEGWTRTNSKFVAYSLYPDQGPWVDAFYTSVNLALSSLLRLWDAYGGFADHIRRFDTDLAWIYLAGGQGRRICIIQRVRHNQRIEFFGYEDLIKYVEEIRGTWPERMREA